MAGVSSALVAFVGSRALGPSAAPVVSRAVGAVLASGRGVAVGCAVGGDALALSAAVAAGGAARCAVFAAFGPGGVGALGGVASVASVLAAASAGASVSWWACGGVAVPPRARLAVRSRAVVSAAFGSGCGAALVCFLAAPPAPVSGSWGAVGWGGALGLPVLVFPLGFSAALLPGPAGAGAGAWVPAGGGGVWAGAVRWAPAALPAHTTTRHQ